MDGYTEKKWFVYLGDHHEGPHSLEELQSKMTQGQITTTNYVWAEGMADWQLISEIQVFQGIIAPPIPIATAAPMQISEPVIEVREEVQKEAHEPTLAAISAPEMAAAESPVLTADISPKIEYSFAPENAQNKSSARADASALDSDFMGEAGTKKALIRSILKIAAVLVLLGGIGVAVNEGYLGPLKNSFSRVTDPVLLSLGISPIPKLDDVEPEEYEQLKSVSKTRLNEKGPQIALALSRGDLISPTFYMASNLPDGVVFDVYLEGIPESLLGQLSASAKTQISLNKRFGKSAAVQILQNGKGLPRGEYTLYVVDPGTQPAGAKAELAKMPAMQPLLPTTGVPRSVRIVATKSYFLGGFKDATYTQRLQEFHQKITLKAQAELVELKQIAGTFEARLNETSQKFSKLKKSKKLAPAQKKSWETFESQWKEMNEQFDRIFSKLGSKLESKLESKPGTNPAMDSSQSDYFYDSLYQMSQRAAAAVNQLHSLQSSFLEGKITDLKAFEIQHGEVSSIAHTAVESLKAKIDEVSAQPPTPSGLPKRDGI